MTQTFHNVPCPGCGCVCDDITIQIADGVVNQFSADCPLGEQWFRRFGKSDWVAPRVSGKETSLESAYARAADLLNASEYPLIYGLSRSSTPGQRQAVALGEKLRGVVDTTASLCHGPSIMALQEIGEVTCTLGEVHNRADLVLFWGSNPGSSHPRHAERYSVHGPGKHLPDGRSDRRVVMLGSDQQIGQWRLDDKETEPDLTIPIPAGKDFETILCLRELLKEGKGDYPALQGVKPQLKQLVDWIRQARYGVVFFGLGLAGEGSWAESEPGNVGHVNVQALLHLVADLNAVTRFSARRMRLQGDVSGADNVMLWQTGYPFAVDFSRGHPRYNPGEFSADKLIERGDVDCCVFVGTETIRYFSETAIKNLQDIPTIVLDYPDVNVDLFSPNVHIATATYGIHAAGTVYRMDNVPIPLQQLDATKLPTDESVLAEMSSRIPEIYGDD